MKHSEINYLEIDKNEKYENQIEFIIEECFKKEGLDKSALYINIVLTNPKQIKQINKETRNIDQETDVLSFPMFEQNEILEIKNNKNDVVDVLGDIVISIEQVKKQATEYGHSFERELSYMVVHGFYHLLGFDHMNDLDKAKMREKEEELLNCLKITR